MTNDCSQALADLAVRIREQFPAARIWVYGSYARETATQESDVDICVVIPEIKHQDRFVISDIAWETGLDHDLHFATVVFSELDFEQGTASASPLRKAIVEDGIAA